MYVRKCYYRRFELEVNQQSVFSIPDRENNSSKESAFLKGTNIVGKK